MVQATRRFEFSAAHRYWYTDGSAEENQCVFGASTSPYGHEEFAPLSKAVCAT
ncbi:hypothetical protein [Candidatus Chloroploca mongolica]|uniref:hypothetical protein n=1 Tax=Candidatus Chloroploca mongolica TaxID=2528176 RepID=UPI0020B3612F|nr:hypothetical protein [Candidatus Chloroploca mongolica]